MADMRLKLFVLPESCAVCRLAADSPVPPWADCGGFASITRTAEELSIVCDVARVPAGVRREGGWRCLKVEGPLDFAMVGVLASLVAPLADAGVSVFAISTFDTDYLFVREGDLVAATAALRRAGHQVSGSVF